MLFSSRNVLAALPAVIAAAVLPSSSDPQGVHIERRTEERPAFVFTDSILNEPNAVFQIPCRGCEHDDALLFNFRAFPSEEPCGIANITVNGQTLSQNWNGTHSVGAGDVRSLPYSSQYRSYSHRLGLSWESSCLSQEQRWGSSAGPQSPAQVITVKLDSVDGRPVELPSGFTVSFRPQIPLELLRISAVPDLTATRQPISALWHNPPPDLRLPPSTAGNSGDDVAPSLADFEQELKQLFAEVAENDKLIGLAYKADMDDIANGRPSSSDEFMRLMDEGRRLEGALIQATSAVLDKHMKELHILDWHAEVIEQTRQNCHTVGCRLDVFIHDVRQCLENIYSKIKPAFAPLRGSSSQQIALDTSSHHRFRPSLTPTPVAGGLATASATSSALSTPHINYDNQYIPTRYEVSLDSVDPFTLTLKIVGAITGLTCLFILIRKSTCCSPRARAERLAAQEERRTARQYRRAARTHRVQQWWAKWSGWRRDTQRMHDYEEKRALIREQEGLLENVMQDEIRLLRAAHDAVSSIIGSSDRGTVRPTPAPIMTQSRFQHPHHAYDHTDVECWHNVPLSRTNSLPDYRSDAGSSHFSSEPPPYSDDEGDLVTDGFRGYRGGDASDDSDTEPLSPVTREPRRWSPGSSVISTSPRPSQETMRFLVRP